MLCYAKRLLELVLSCANSPSFCLIFVHTLSVEFLEKSLPWKSKIEARQGTLLVLLAAASLPARAPRPDWTRAAKVRPRIFCTLEISLIRYSLVCAQCCSEKGHWHGRHSPFTSQEGKRKIEPPCPIRLGTPRLRGPLREVPLPEGGTTGRKVLTNTTTRHGNHDSEGRIDIECADISRHPPILRRPRWIKNLQRKKRVAALVPYKTLPHVRRVPEWDQISHAGDPSPVTGTLDR